MSRNPFRHKGRCHCHRRRKEHGKLILLCDVILAVVLLFVVFLAVQAFVYPSLNLPITLGWLVNGLGTGYVVVLIAIALNFFWAIYYGCQKSIAGAILSLMTGFIMLRLYNVF